MNNLARLSRFSLVLCAVFAVLATQHVRSQPQNNYTLLWQISGNGLASPSFLFGSAHVKDNRAFQFSDSVMLALEACDLFALEIHPDSMVKHTLDLRKQESDQTNAHRLTDEQAAEVMSRYRSKFGHDPDRSILNNPYLIKELIRPDTIKPDDRVTSVDIHLLGIAQTLRKAPRGLEQLGDLFVRFGGEQSISSLFTDDHTASDALREQILAVYGKGDLEELWQLVGPYVENNASLLRRNREMTRQIIQLMDEGTLFAVAGVLHLPGDRGIIAQLRAAGYTLRPVEATFTGVANRYSIDPSKMLWQTVTDSANHFRVDLPPGYYQLEPKGNSTKLRYSGLTNDYNLSVTTWPTSGLSTDEHLNQVLNHLQANPKVSILEQHFLTADSIPALDLKMRVGHNYEHSRVFVHNNMQYILTCQYASEKADPTLPTRFLDSFVGLSSAPRSNHWQAFKHAIGAFEVQLPNAPEERVMEETDSSFVEHGPQKIHLFAASDHERGGVYLVRYNDFQPGVYLTDKDAVFDAFIQHAASQGELIGAPTEVIRSDLVGKAASVKTTSGVLMEMEAFTRGNRIYLLMKSSPYEDRPTHDDPFFQSFRVLPVEPPVLHPFSVGTLASEVPGTPKIWNSQPDEIGPILSENKMAFSVDPHSGTLYGLETSALKPYARMAADSLYQGIIAALIDQEDTLMTTTAITVDAQLGKTYRVRRKTSDLEKRIQTWMTGNQLYVIQALGNPDHLDSPAVNRFFAQARSTAKAPGFDPSASKAQALVRDLRSTDTTVLSAARDALFTYYSFDSTETTYLRDALAYSYADNDSTEQNTKRQLIRELTTLRDQQSVPELKRIFDDDRTSAPIKAAVLANITRIDSSTFDWYFDALTSRNPMAQGFAYEIVAPLYDSLSFVGANLHRLHPLLATNDYRSTVLSLASSLVYNDAPAGLAAVQASKVVLAQHASADLDTFFHHIELQDDEEDYSTIYSYLNLLPTLDTAALVQTFTAPLLQQKDNRYLQASAVGARVRAGVDVDETLLLAHLEDLRTRRQILEAFHRAGQLDRVPTSYFTNEAMAMLSLYEYIYEYGDYPESVNLLGKLQHGDKTYHVLEWTWLDDEDRYIGVCQPIDLEFIDNGPFELYPCISDFEPVDEHTDWQGYAQQLIEQMNE